MVGSAVETIVWSSEASSSTSISAAKIRRTRGGDWPEEAVTPEFDLADLIWHEVEFRDGYSYSYTLRDAEGGYLGCAYLYPMGRRTELRRSSSSRCLQAERCFRPSE